jgi:hypothetical protein
MRQWFYERPWIWIVFLLAFVVSGGLVTLVIAERNKPTIVKPKTTLMVDPSNQTHDTGHTWIASLS